MATRKIQFINNEFYHIFNRGADKRDIFIDFDDMDRFFQSMEEFNVIEPIGGIYKNSFHQQLRSKAPQLSRSSWGEYIGKEKSDFCKKDIILDQFKNTKEYKNFAEDSLKDIREIKEADKLLLG